MSICMLVCVSASQQEYTRLGAIYLLAVHCLALLSVCMNNLFSFCQLSFCCSLDVCSSLTNPDAGCACIRYTTQSTGV